MYIEGPLHEPYFIALMLQGETIIRLTKKLVTSCMVEDLVLLN